LGGLAVTKSTHIRFSDLRGFARLAVQATGGLTDLVEAMHRTIAHPAGWRAPPTPGRTRGITGLVYRSIGGVTRLVGGSLDAILAQLTPALDGPGSSPEREAVLAALNGVLGDYLAVSDNPLAIGMSLRRNGRPLALDNHALRTVIPQASPKVAVLAHGLCMNDRQWSRQRHDHGGALARDLGYTPVYLHYNSGLHTSVNGLAFAALLEVLIEQWPVPVAELAVIAHSMGGLVARSACHYGAEAGHHWPRHLRQLVFLGTPHHGAPLERGGNWVDVLLGAAPYSAPFARLGKIRSAGITDLRYGNLRTEDWEGRDRFARGRDTRLHTPLPSHVRSYAVAASIGKKPSHFSDRLVGDGLVPVNSALGIHKESDRCLAFPKSGQWVGYGMNHLDLLSRRAVYEQIRRWLDT
jgi:hypothetical protein